ncbi:MAG: DUF1553 domain-containing protein [Acidobacteriota bacterium]
MNSQAPGRLKLRNSIAVLIWLATAIVLSLVSPGTSSAQGKESVETTSSPALQVFPKDVTLWRTRNTQRLVVIHKPNAGLERDVTNLSRFSIANPTVARVDAFGRLEALQAGKTVVKVEFGGSTQQAAVRVEDSGEDMAPTFSRDVESILTMSGCNGSNCHGGVKGKGGFKLSLNGAYPREDYRWIVEGGTYRVLTDQDSGPKVPRIDLQNPAQSLLLMKPTAALPHGGGERFPPDSAEYETLLSWIRGGAPYGGEDEQAGRIEGIEVFPSQAVLEPGGRRQLLITALLSNGRREDITDKVLYLSNNADLVKVDSKGAVEAVMPGETAVLVRAPSYSAVATIGVISNRVARYPEVAPRNFIDEHVFAKLRKFQIVPSELSADAEFLRRVCLDVTGTLPPPNRVREFLEDRDPKKREKLLEVLLQSPEYVDYWTFRYGDLFRVALHPAGGIPKFSQSYWEWLRNAIAQNEPYDLIARERIAAQGYEGASRHYLPILQPPLPEDAVAEEVRVFLGRRIDCAQCHDHPFENWAQDQFWGMAAFFQRLTFFWFLEVGTDALVLDDPGGYSRRGNMGRVIHPRSKKEIQPTFPDGTVLTREQARDPRLALARWMTAQPEFAETAVNRMWGHFFGRGIVDPVDDFRSTNPPTHPELLKALAEDFRANKHDLKHLIRRIVNSRTYQLASAANETNRSDRTNYSRRVPRPLDAEVLLDAISQVAGVPEVFGLPSGGRAPAGTRAINLKEPDMYPSQFLEVHGRPSRQMVPERNAQPNLRQALHRLAGATYTEKLSSQNGRVDRLLKGEGSYREIVEEFYLAALSRHPSPRESLDLTGALRDAEVQHGSKRRAVEDFLWALLNSQEFTNY